MSRETRRGNEAAGVAHVLAGDAAVVGQSVNGLLAAESEALVAMRATVSSVTSAMVDQLDRIAATYPEPAAQAAMARGVMRRGAEVLEQELGSTILAARVRAKGAGSVAFSQQIDALFGALRRYGVPVPKALTLARLDASDIDTGRSAALAKSFSSAWLMQANEGIRQWQAGGGKGSLTQAIRKARAQTDFRARRGAATEVASAYNQGHQEQLAAAASQLEQHPVGRLLFKRWEAALDRKTCMTCANHDNEVVRAHESFYGSASPGEVHPHCRCVAVLAAFSTDLNVAHAVTRDLAGPGIGRAAIGRGAGAFEDFEAWPEETKARWFKMYDRARRDPEYRARLISPEVHRHLARVEQGEQAHARIVPRLRKDNLMRQGRRTDARSPRAIHEEYLGGQTGTPYAHFVYGDLVGTKAPSRSHWKPVQ